MYVCVCIQVFFYLLKYGGRHGSPYCHIAASDIGLAEAWRGGGRASGDGEVEQWQLLLLELIIEPKKRIPRPIAQS
jgi:hypothetical protein